MNLFFFSFFKACSVVHHSVTYFAVKSNPCIKVMVNKKERIKVNVQILSLKAKQTLPGQQVNGEGL